MMRRGRYARATSSTSKRSGYHAGSLPVARAHWHWQAALSRAGARRASQVGAAVTVSEAATGPTVTLNCRQARRAGSESHWTGTEASVTQRLAAAGGLRIIVRR